MTRQQPPRTDICAGPAGALGDVALLDRKKLALICSQKFPGDVILNTYDFARLVRGSAIVISVAKTGIAVFRKAAYTQWQ